MKGVFRIGFKGCGLITSPINVEYILKFRQINVSTYIYALDITLRDGDFRSDRWVLRFLGSVDKHLPSALMNLFEKFIRTILITDDLLWSIGASELVKFKNKMEDHDIQIHEQAELDNLKKAMLDMNITIIENDDIFFDCNETPDLTIFRFNNWDPKWGESDA